MDHYTSRYGSTGIYTVNFAVLWTITQANMEVVVTHAKSFVSCLIFELIYVLLVSRGQTAFFVFICGGGKKGLVWFTDASRLDTFKCVNKLHHQYSSI